ncbi:MAG: hypothetical protein ACTSY1_01155, partial [Alphaproteobacteria bacterium]
LTYMSIDDLIIDRVARGMLFPVIPKALGAVPRRAMFVAEELNQALISPEGDEIWEERIGRLGADLEIFAEGMPIHPNYLFLLYPLTNAVWEIRSVRPYPSVRVLGLFAKRDVFIATNFALREDLGGWQSREWKNVKRLARTKWVNLFHTFQPVVSADVRMLVTGAIDGRYFRERS